jgi:hypothetical protein
MTATDAQRAARVLEMAVGAELGEPSKGGRGKNLCSRAKVLEPTLRSEFRLLYRGREAIEPSGGVP